MKHSIALFTIIFSLYHFTNAQDTTYTRKGFYTNLGIGISGGFIQTQFENSPIHSYSGSGTSLSFLIGSSLKENLVLHAFFYGSGIVNATAREDGDVVRSAKIIRYGTRIIGGGITLYNKSNFFFSPNIGWSKIRENKNSNSGRSDAGLGIYVRVGREWWLGEKWSGGIAFSYLRSSGKTEFDTGESKWSSNSLSVVFSLGLN